ncbi:MAG: hypothetical protein P4L22_07595 [Candidatus Babeliales bacterium]|nr:hypothetical protein [Candidatus Babeliales bacterium]
MKSFLKLLLVLFSFSINASESPNLKPYISYLLKDFVENHPELPSGITDFKNAHEGIITSVKISPNNKLLASGSGDGSIKIWDIHTGKFIYELKKEDHFVRSISWSPDSSMLAILYRNRKLIIFDVNDSRLLDEKSFQTGLPTIVSWSPDGSRIAVGAENKIIIYAFNAGCSLLMGQEVVLKDKNNTTTSLIWISDTKLLSVGNNGKATSWSVDHKIKKSIQLDDLITSADILSRYFLFSLKNKSIVKLNWAKGNYFLLDVKDIIRALKVLKNTEFLVTGGISGNIIIRNMIGKTKIVDTYQVSDLPITDIDWSNDGKFIVASSDKTLTIWKDPLKTLNLNAKNRSINDLLDSINDNYITEEFNDMTQEFNEIDIDVDSLFLNDLDLTSLSGLETLITNPDRIAFVLLENNKIRSLDNKLKQFKALMELNLDGNEIKDLNDSLDGLENLQLVDINRNKLTSLGSLKGLQKLETFNVQDNQIVDIGNSFDDLIASQTLKTLNISGNPLSQESLDKLRALKAASPVGLKIDVLE